MKRTKEDALKTKEALIDAALEVFLAKGFAATTLEDIAKKAGTTRGAIYWHFKGKDDFYREIYEREHQLYMSLFDKIFESDLGPFLKLRTLARSIIENFYNNKRYSKYIELTSFKIEYSAFENVNTRKTRTNNFVLSTFEKLAREAIEDKSIKENYKADEVAKTLLLFIVGIYRLKFTAPQSFKNLDESTAIIDNYLNSIQGKSNSS